jgi:Mrp family chromosome partitioning ATPase
MQEHKTARMAQEQQSSASTALRAAFHRGQTMLVQTSQGQSGSAHVVVLGNEKGGSAKSTVALQVAVALLKAGQRVATIDLDCRQQKLHPLHR